MFMGIALKKLIKLLWNRCSNLRLRLTTLYGIFSVILK